MVLILKLVSSAMVSSQGSVVGPLLFLLFICGLRSPIIKHYLLNNLQMRKSLSHWWLSKRIKQSAEHDLIHRLNANKISLSDGKIGVIFFFKKEEIIPNILIIVNGSKLYNSKSLRYLGLGEHLYCSFHLNYLKNKLSTMVISINNVCKNIL